MRKPPKNSHFDKTAADRVVNFIEKFATHTKGELAGQPFKLAKWQKEDILYPAFGTKRKDGLRQYRTVYVEVPRKNGKSTLAAPIGLYLTMADGEAGAEVYSAAGDRDQARIVFSVAKSMIANSSRLGNANTVLKNSIFHKKSGSFYKVISADANTKHGFNAHGIIFDELHVQPNSELFDVLTTSVGARSQPIVFIITTAGLINTFAESIHDYAIKVRDGVIKDDTFLPVIYAADPDDDITKVATWKKANPGYGSIVKRDYLVQMSTKAKNLPSFVNQFKRLHLNIWTGSESAWISDYDWKNCNKSKLKLEDFAGRKCYAGLDLASTQDLSSLVLVFPDEENKSIDALSYSWCPEDTVLERTRNENINYAAWVREGLVYATPGNIQDYAFIQKKILEIAEIVDLQSIGFDRYNSFDLVPKLMEAGLEMVPIAQTMSNLSNPYKMLEKLVVSEKLNHGGNPVMRWQMANVHIISNSNGDIKADKKKSKDKIDSVVAMAMAVYEWMQSMGKNTSSVYDERGVIEL